MKRSFILISCLATIIFSILVIGGWLLDVDFFLRISSRAPSMKFNTALLFLLSGGSLWLVYRRNEKNRNLVWVLAAVTGFIAAYSLTSYLVSGLPDLDNLFVADDHQIPHPGRMSPGTALCFLLLSTGFGLVSTSRTGLQTIAQRLFHVVGLIGLVANMGYILDVPATTKIPFLQTMAIHTSLLFMLIGPAASLAAPPTSTADLLIGRFAGSRLLRFLVIYSTFVPMTMAIVFLTLANRESVSLEFGMVVMTVTFIVLNLILLSALPINILNQSHQKRQKLEDSLSLANLELSSYQLALNTIAMVSVTDQHGVILDLNENLAKALGYSREELIGKTHRKVRSGEHNQVFFKNMWETIGSGKPWVGEIKNLTKDKRPVWMLTSIIPLGKDEDGRPEKFLSIRQDITRLKEAEEFLMSENGRLAFLNKEIEQFAYITSHDLQQPLRTFANSLEVLEEVSGDQLDDIGKQCVTFMKGATERMSTLVRDLLEYSRIGTQKEAEPVNLDEVVAGVVADLATQIDETGTQIAVGKLPEVHGYLTELRLLFQNLISNAIKFRRPEVVPEIGISASLQGDCWQFEVSDNGIGIDPENQEKVFGMFQRLHHQEEYEGTGIGLSHCRKIVDLHKGSIWLNSVPGEGSNFYFTIPHSSTQNEKKTRLHSAY